jgi:UDP-glucose 4-epimerase
MEPMKALVTGGAGFIGSAIAGALVARGDDVTVLDSFITGFEANVPEGAELVRADLGDDGAVADACREVEVVFHQGALRSVPRSVDDPMATNEANITGTLNLLVAAEAAGVRRLVYASSSSVYGDCGGALQTEDLPTDPRSPYAVSKLAGEHYCRAWSHLGRLSTVSLRYFNVFGPGQHPDSKYAAVFPAFISALTKGNPPEVHWDGEQSRDFTFIGDVVEANLAAAEASDDVSGEVLNVGGGGAKTVNEVLATVSDFVGTWIEPNYTPKRTGDVRHTRADIRKAAHLLSWHPEAQWSDAVKATVTWFEEVNS